MNNYELIDSIMSKAAPGRALPDHVRREFAGMKKDILVGILKSAGKYTLFTAVVINLFILAKKLGLGVSAVKLQIAVKAVLVVTASATAVTTGTVVYRQYVKAVSAPVNIQPSETETVAVTEAVPAAPVQEAAPVPVYSFEIIPFDCPADEPQMAESLSKTVAGVLQRSFGDKSAVVAGGAEKYRSKYTLRGSCSKLGTNYYLSVRLVSSGTSRIITIINKTASGGDDLNRKAEEIVGEISAMKLP